jgi:DNA invertase Pin-like site-specific DNA recombinase
MIMNDVTPGAGRQSVAVYLRGSSANRRWQRAECKNFAAAHYGGVPVEFYEDGERCADGRWAEADRLMLDLDAGALAAVIINYGLTRFVRTPATLERLAESWVPIYSVHGEDFDLSTSDGRFKFRLVAVMALEQAEARSARARDLVWGRRGRRGRRGDVSDG